jgi:glycosyltransferase involved in cell wall biosynthesis
MHVHALEWFLCMETGGAPSSVLSQATHLIACSNAVSENLTRAHGIPRERIDTVHEAIPVLQIRAERSRAEIFRELDLPNDASLVLGSGRPYWGKGADLFVRLAQSVCRQHSNAYFAWIGGGSTLDTSQFEHDIRLTQLSDRLRVTGLVRQPADYLAASDMFVLTSREDSFPLVCLEAAALGKPIICFAEAGGMPEFVEKDCGFIVPYLDIEGMAKRVTCLLDSSDFRIKMGEAARRKVTERHDIGIAGPRIMDVIERVIAGGEEKLAR